MNDLANNQVLSSTRRVKSIRSLLPFLGPAFIAGVAYIDPGNFATNIASGSQYGYMLLWVVLVSNLMAILIQILSAKLGIATGKNLPEVARENLPKSVSFGLWIQGELVVMATDLAEFIGAALGLYLLFGIPLLPAALIAAVGSYAILELQRRGFRPIEAVIAGMVFIVVIAFVIQVIFAQPNYSEVLQGFFTPQFKGVDSVMMAAGILGATVMPHAIYLHSALTQKRIIGRNDVERKRIFRFEFIDILIAMSIAGVVNACMLIVAAALFHKNGLNVQDLDVAFQQFGEVVGTFSAILFGIGLLSSGLASSAVGTMSGDIIMQGFIRRRISLYLRRAITVLPPILIIAIGVNPTTALVISQIILSFGIPFALIPLIVFTSNKQIMGNLANRRITNILAIAIAMIIILLNVILVIQTFSNI
ncbi:divalent metal cation transporter [Cohnella sp. CIP 111063]|uniref:Nramp family divalent metal transporter n=1 Tax=unclassified Cohnella TaxID=2636738 RepID=UPI000B9D2621|nr:MULTISPECIES: Nramp family divalent metal transporter [unclassified Cohnella]OXS54907.1 divalent metal cation transporter [Cohnella sp. CIP 111063]PRX65057.1 manganese transport protein [Cohnella sp. SGD-V74]